MQRCGLEPCDQSKAGLLNSMQRCGLEPCDQSKAGLLNSMENCRLEPCDQSSLGLLNSMENSGTATLSSALASLQFSTAHQDRKSTRLNSSHQIISYAVFCLKKKKYI